MSFEFGALSSINPITATLAFILTIIFLLFFEFLTGALEYLIEGNLVYNQMLQKIYKELMCMGFVSFVLAIYRAENNATHLDSLFRVTEFIEYLLFFQALFYVAHSLYIMFISVVTSSYYEKLHARSVLDILGNFTKLEKSWSASLLSTISFLPLSRTIQEAEFKIIYALFRDTYWLPLDFDYGAYLSGCLANYALKLINIGVYSWVIMISLSLLNLGRLKVFGNNAFNCEGYQYVDDVEHHESNYTDHHHRSLSSSSSEPQRVVTHHCEKQHLYLFLICGGLLCVYTTLLSFVAQTYMRRLLGRAGVLSLSDYGEFLMFEERSNINTEKRKIEIHKDHGTSPTNQERSSSRKARRMTIRTFKSNIANLRAASGDHHNEEFEVYRKISRALSVHFHVSDYFHQAWEWITDTVSSFYYSYFTPRVHDSGQESRAKLIFRDTSLRTQAKEVEVKSMDSVDIENGNNSSKEDAADPSHPAQSNPPGRSRRKRRVSTMLLLSGGPLANSHHLNTMELKTQDSMTAVERFKLHKFQQITDQDEKMEFLKNVRKNDNKTREEMKLTEDMSQIYLFNSPELFCRAIEAGIMLNSLYLALWATNFLYVVVNTFHNNVSLHLMLLFPVVYVLPCIGEIVKASSLLSAIAELNLNVIGSVLEETDDRSSLVLELQNKINIRLEGVVATQKEVLSSLFDEIDTDGSGFINRAEFRNMMQALHLHYSDEKFKRLFKAVDRNKDGSISIDELYQILFPEKAEEEEIQKRTEMVEKHIEERRQSHINNSIKPVKYSGALAVLNGFSKTVETPEVIHEDTESKNLDNSDNPPSPIVQKPNNSFNVSGRVVRLSKAATTGRISVPLQDFQAPSKKFEKPKVFAEEILHTNSTESKKPIEQVHNFTALAEVPSPRNNSNPMNSMLDMKNTNPYHAIHEEDENHSDLETIEDIPNGQTTLPTTRKRSKSDESQSRKNSAAVPITVSRNTLIDNKSLENSSSQSNSQNNSNSDSHSNSNSNSQNNQNHTQEFDTVSGFDDNLTSNENTNNNNQSSSQNNNNNNNNNNGGDQFLYEASMLPSSQNSNVVHLPPINHLVTSSPNKNWNVADIEEDS